MTKSTIRVERLSRNFVAYQKNDKANPFVDIFFRKKKIKNAVNDISFEIFEGDFVGFLGPNGAGKTTTLKMLSGVLTPSSGTCNVLGFTPHQRKREFKKQISLIMGQKSQLIWDLPALDTFLLHRDLYQLDNKYWKSIRDVLIELLDVKNVINVPVRQLSLGERMKCELIVSLLHQPRVLFLDEPTIGLDVVSQKHLWAFLRSYQKTNRTTILLTSHYMEDITNLCSRVIVINKGQLAYNGGLDELIQITQPEKNVLLRFSRQLLPLENKKLKELIIDIKNVDRFTYAIKIPRPVFASVMTNIFRDFPVEDIQVQEADLSLVMERSFALRQS